MKTRNGFVSNSSSTSFVIENISHEPKTLLDFVEEIGAEMVEKFHQEFSWYSSEELTLEDLLSSARNEFNSDSGFYTVLSGHTKIWTFGDEDGTAIGHVFDYMLREGGTSQSFTWSFSEYNR